MSDVNPNFLIIKENLAESKLEIVLEDDDILDIQGDSLDMIGRVYRNREEATKLSDPQSKAVFIDEDLENLIFADFDNVESTSSEEEEFDPEYRAPDDSYLVLEETFSKS